MCGKLYVKSYNNNIIWGGRRRRGAKLATRGTSRSAHRQTSKLPTLEHHRGQSTWQRGVCVVRCRDQVVGCRWILRERHTRRGFILVQEAWVGLKSGERRNSVGFFKVIVRDETQVEIEVGHRGRRRVLSRLDLSSRHRRLPQLHVALTVGACLLRYFSDNMAFAVYVRFREFEIWRLG